MILHTVNKSPATHHCLAECADVCTDTDSVLLIEDGVYGALAQYQALLATPRKVYALMADVDARGLRNRLHAKVLLVDDTGFVQLAAEHDKVISWY